MENNVNVVLSVASNIRNCVAGSKKGSVLHRASSIANTLYLANQVNYLVCVCNDKIKIISHVVAIPRLAGDSLVLEVDNKIGLAISARRVPTPLVRCEMEDRSLTKTQYTVVVLSQPNGARYYVVDDVYVRGITYWYNGELTF
jgi:hypothetical protein